MELDELKKNTVEKVISSIAGGIAYCHFVEYNFKKSLEEPNLKPVNYRIFAPKLYENAKQLWVEGLASLKEYDLSRSTNLFSKNFTEELYLSGDKRISLHIKGQVVSSITSSKTMEIVVTKPKTPSEYEYYDIEFKVLTPVIATYRLATKTGDDSGVHKKFMDDVKHDLGCMSGVLHFGVKDFDDFDNEVTRSFAKFPDLQSAKEAIKMAILFTWPTTYNPQKNYVALIPPAFEIPQKKGKKQITAGGVALFTNNYLSLSPLLFDCLQNWVSIHTTKQLVDFSRNEAIKSAKAAIMSRNMSHNLGSHVMFYIKQRLESVEKILQTGTLQDLIKSNSIEGIRERIKDSSTQPGEEMPFLVGLGRFINYLQERQDYIATVATDYIPYKTSISFKDAIYDELKPDLRARRHNNDNTVKGKQPANLLLDYIAYSEGFHPSKCIKLKFGDVFDGTSQDVPNDLRKLNVALPSGNLGRQAFFSIMENIIRNTAKHDGATNAIGGVLGFQFDILDGAQLNNFDFIAIADDAEKENQKERMIKRLKCYGNKLNKENYYYIGITANTDGPVKDVNGVLQIIQNGLIDRYVTDDGQMRDEYKGIKEMRISAAWMRGYSIDTDIPINEPPALAVRDNCGHIQYIICLPKPKKIAFVCSTHEQIKDERMPEGLKLFMTLAEQKGNTTEDTKAVKRYVKDNDIADYELIVCTEEDKKRLLPYVGSRIYTCDDMEIINFVKAVQDDERKRGNDSVNVIGDIYIKWLEQKFKCQSGEKLSKLVINDGQAYENHISDTNGSRKRNVELGNDRIIFNSGDSTSNQLVYSKHYNPKEHRFYDQAPFVEGISGGNSTDRLLRQDEWTKEWYVKHITAALTKVAIFDERIYSNFIRHNTSKGWSKARLEEWLKEHQNKLHNDNPTRSLWIEMRNHFSSIKKEDIAKLLETKDNEVSFTKDVEKINSFLRLLPQDSIDYSVADLFRRKGVWAFNIKVEEKRIGEKCVIIMGYTEKNGETEIARLIKRSDQQDIVLIVDDGFKKKFHFVTIHQGILDKIYSALGISKEEKNKVTEELFDKFCDSEKVNGYLPQFIIHSGRSKPNDTDMPQKQPFIQFAALDHAVKDCKYTLTELLYSAHYES